MGEDEPPKGRGNSAMLLSVTLMYTLVFCLYELRSVVVSLEYLALSPRNNSFKLTGNSMWRFEWLHCIMSVAYQEHKTRDGAVIQAISAHILL